MEYSEHSGGIVHINSTDGYRNNDSPSDIARFRELIDETIKKVGAHSTTSNPSNRKQSNISKNSFSSTRTIVKNKYGSNVKTTKTNVTTNQTTVRLKPKPKPIDYTVTPDSKNRIKCPAKNCGVWNNVMDSICRYCGGNLKTSSKITVLRERLLQKQMEEQQRLEREKAMYATKPEPSKKPEPVKKEPAGPAYKKYKLQITQLGTAYASLAETKLKREGIKTLSDLTLALKDPNRDIQANVKKLLPKLISEENALSFAKALRNPETRPAAEVALKGCGYIGASALFKELEANNGSSAQSLVRAIAPLGTKAIPLIEQHLIPQWVPVYPVLADALVAIGKPSLPMLCRLLTDTEDEYILQFREGTLARFKDKAVSSMDNTLETEARWDRKKRVIDCFGRVKSPKAIPILTKFTQIERHGIYLSARESLAKIGTREALLELGQLFGAGSTDLVETTLKLMMESKGPITQVLSELAKDDSSRVRRFAIQGLGHFTTSNPEIVPVIKTALNDSDRGVRNKAKAMLK